MRAGQGLRWREGDTANLCIGQGYLDVTPLQIAVMIGAIANGGTVVQPRVVDRIVSQPGTEDGPGPRTFPYEVRGRAEFDPAHLALIRRVMREDVANSAPGPNQGTGYRAEVPGMNICAKTGTAENKRGGRVVRKDVWFASFAPLEDPRYVVIVMVEGGVFGGTTAAPVAREIYRAIQKREASGEFPRPRQLARR
jgi:penicillin-binding protein 2